VVRLLSSSNSSNSNKETAPVQKEAEETTVCIRPIIIRSSNINREVVVVEEEVQTDPVHRAAVQHEPP
jgi:hypothetical protein